LTQEELAGRAGLSADAIGALERGKRRRPYPHTVRSLADALELDEEERASLLASVPKRSGGRVVQASVPELIVPVPPTPLFGRERALEEITAFLERPGLRILTLTGIGGVGKTRLALEAAARMASRSERAVGRFLDGVAFVPLASLSDPALVVPTVARSLGLRETGEQTSLEVLQAYLREKGMLLVLDNLEHLLGAAAEVAALIEACPNLTVLATSRSPLRIRGEQEYPVKPLVLPVSAHTPDVGRSWPRRRGACSSSGRKPSPLSSPSPQRTPLRSPPSAGTSRVYPWP
jgi:transcriptional regulator with XRE-family HTH domain